MAYKLGYHFKTTTQILARLMSFNRLFEQNVIVNYPRRLHFCRLLGQTQFFCSVQQFLKLPFFICTMDLLRRVCLHFQYRCAFDSLSIEKSRFFLAQFRTYPNPSHFEQCFPNVYSTTGDPKDLLKCSAEKHLYLSRRRSGIHPTKLCFSSFYDIFAFKLEFL